jgi:opacity protein-like surface antigen
MNMKESAMNRHLESRTPTQPGTSALALLVFSLVALAIAIAIAPARSHAAELVPSYGLTRAVDGGDQVKGMFGLALRGNLIPNVLQSEIGAGYRTEDMSNGAIHVRQWPITASLLLTPMNVVYADAGVGWYHTTYDYESDLIGDETVQKFGVHLGGGIKVPVAPRVALDLGGRYVKLQDQESKLIPEKFNPSFWTLSMGLALKF